MAPAIRNFLICALAFVFAWGAPKWNRRELAWLTFPLLTYGAARLLVEDLQSGRTVTLCVSLVFYGGALLLIPRRARTKATKPT